MKNSKISKFVFYLIVGTISLMVFAAIAEENKYEYTSNVRNYKNFELLNATIEKYPKYYKVEFDVENNSSNVLELTNYNINFYQNIDSEWHMNYTNVQDNKLIKDEYYIIPGGATGKVKMNIKLEEEGLENIYLEIRDYNKEGKKIQVPVTYKNN